MSAQDCPGAAKCSACLCPLGDSVGWLSQAAWFPGEAICARQGEKPRWVDVQRRIDKVTGGDRRRGYFTVRMLEALTAVHPTIQGLDVDTHPEDEPAAVAAWCAKRKRAVLSAAEIERRREHGRKVAAVMWGKSPQSGQYRSDFRADCPASEQAPCPAGTPGHVGGAA